MKPLDRRVIMPPTQLVELRGPSGRKYGMLDPQQLTIEFKKGEQVERVDLRPYIEATKR